VLRGILPPLVTPFHPDGALDLASFEANLESYAAEDLAGYVVLGSNGEAASLEEDEKLALLRAARRRAGSRLVIAGTGLESTRSTIAFTRRAADTGADAALVLTPSSFKSQMTVEALRRHYDAVAEASSIPVLLYSFPAVTGLPFPLALAAAVAGHPRIVGMKESSGDVGLFGRIVASVPASFAVACGSAPAFYPSLCIGAAAGILAVANCAPRPAAALYRAFAASATHGVAGLKAAVDLAGRRGGSVRSPLVPLVPAVRDELRRLLDAAESAVRS